MSLVSEMQLNAPELLSNFVKNTSAKQIKIIMNVNTNTETPILLVSPEVFDQIYEQIKVLGIYKREQI